MKHNELKYIDDAINMSQSSSNKYVLLLECLIKKHINRKYVTAVASTYEANLLIDQVLDKDNKLKIIETNIICNVAADIGILNFEKDSRFKKMDSGALIVTDNEVISQNIRMIIKKNEDFILSPVLASIAITYLENECI